MLNLNAGKCKCMIRKWQLNYLISEFELIDAADKPVSPTTSLAITVPRAPTLDALKESPGNVSTSTLQQNPNHFVPS